MPKMDDRPTNQMGLPTSDADLGLNRQSTDPMPAPRTTRFQEIRNLTSMPAGRVVPIVAIPLLREDALRRCAIQMSFESMETGEILMNGIFVSVKAYLVSNLALDRFDGMDALNRSYKGVAVEGLSVVPWFEMVAAGAPGVSLIDKYLGLHYKAGDQINTHYVEAYNQIWNMRARNRSPDLNPRTRLDQTLAPAFWRHQQFRHVVPSFDQAIIDGEVPISITGGGTIPVRGFGMNTATVETAGPTNFRTSGSASEAMTGYYSPGSAGSLVVDGQAGLLNIYAELGAAGMSMSLANIEVARKTQAFARIKETYQGLTDEYIIDLLMSAIRVPEQQLNQPILLGEKTTVFGQSKRYATDAENLTESVVNGATMIDLTFRVPQLNTGGVVMVTAEALPEQLWERQRDPHHFASAVAQLPDFLRDSLDPEKVEIVTNGQIDAAHATPTGTFGYAPLNWKWMMQAPKIGGKFYRPDPADTTNDEIRQRIWAVETVNPTLAADFYIATNINTKPFVVTNQDPFEVVTRGMAVIDGVTVFGGALVESTGSYDEVMAKAPMQRLPTSST